MLRLLAAYTRARRPLTSVTYRNYFEVDHMKVDEFFNREVEIHKLKSIFEGSSNTTLYLLHGPPNCGKSRVVSHYLENSTVPYIVFDLRGNKLMNSDDLLNGLNKTIDSALETTYLSEIMKRTNPKGKTDVNTLKLTTEYKEALVEAGQRVKGEKMSVNKIVAAAECYEEIGKFFPGYNKHLLFFLDEVNRIKELIPQDPDSKQAFRDIISGFIKVTKQERMGNVLMGTTDINYNMFLHSLGFPLDYFTRLTMGFFNEKDMKRYMRECCPGINDEILDIIWSTVGGNVQHFMRYTLSSELSGKEITVDDHKKAASEMLKLHYAEVIKCNFEMTKSAQECSALSKIYRELALSKNGTLNYGLVEKDLGKPVIEALLKHGVLYVLAGEYISRDIEKADDEVLIVPNSPLDLVTMKKFMVNPTS